TPSVLFKLAQHAIPRLEDWSPGGERTTWCASHDGYRDLAPGLRHRRTLTLEHASGALTVSDELAVEAGEARPVQACSSLHLAPGTKVERAGGGRLVLSRDGVVLEIQPRGFEQVDVEPTTVSERYGVALPSRVVRLRTRVRPGESFGYDLRPL